MTKETIYQLFPIHLPIAKNGVFWNGKPDEFSNINLGLDFSQEYGLTPYSKTGVYGYYKGKLRPHNGIDLAGNDGTPLVMPCKGFITYAGFNEGGYGNCIFFETETKTLNGDTVKMEYVLAHMRETPIVKPGHWYEEQTFVGYMGSTGMSTGIHTHFAPRPWIRLPNGDFEYLYKDDFTQSARGYIDPVPMLIEKPVYDKQALINQAKIDLIIKNMVTNNEKKIIVEGEGHGRKFVVVDGKLREIKEGREADAALYVLTNQGFGQTTSTNSIDKMPKGKDF